MSAEIIDLMAERRKRQDAIEIATIELRHAVNPKNTHSNHLTQEITHHGFIECVYDYEFDAIDIGY